MFSTSAFLENELNEIDYFDFVDQNVTGLAGRMRPMPREIENRIIGHINNRFRRSFVTALATIIDGTFTAFREDNEVRRRVNAIDEFFNDNGLGDSLRQYYRTKAVSARSFSQWFYDIYLLDIQKKILEVSDQLAIKTANNLNEIADCEEISTLILRQEDFGADGLPKRTVDVQNKQKALLDFFFAKYSDAINDKLCDIVDGSGQFFADPILEAVEDLLGMKSRIRERLIRVIERRHDSLLSTKSQGQSGLMMEVQNSHFEDLAFIVTKAIGVSEHLKSELSVEQGGEVQKELERYLAEADSIQMRIGKEAADFASHIERWAS